MSRTSPTRPSALSLMNEWFERARLWLVYGSVVIVIGCLYLGSFLGSARDVLLPAALGLLTAFAVQSLQTIERQTGPRTGDTEFAVVSEALPSLRKLVASDRQATDVKVVAATGWTTVRQVLPAICASSKAPVIRVTMLVVEPSGPLIDVYPEHWRREVDEVLGRVRQTFTDSRLQVSVSAYKHLPPIHGLMLNDQYLLVGFFGWANTGSGPELTGAERPHRLYRRGDAASSQFFEMFDEWFQHVPQTHLLTQPATS
jgi:hypothetical protein